jgi:hypothetical protein
MGKSRVAGHLLLAFLVAGLASSIRYTTGSGPALLWGAILAVIIGWIVWVGRMRRAAHG